MESGNGKGTSSIQKKQGTTNYIFLIMNIIHETLEIGEEVYMAFVDLMAAFDIIQREIT